MTPYRMASLALLAVAVVLVAMALVGDGNQMTTGLAAVGCALVAGWLGKQGKVERHQTDR